MKTDKCTASNIKQSENSELVDENPKSCSPHIKETEKIPQKKVAQVEIPKIYCVTPEPLSSLKDGDEIMFVGKIGNMFALKTKECINKNKELICYIKELDKSGKLYIALYVVIQYLFKNTKNWNISCD